jgi:hypothetical protein
MMASLRSLARSDMTLSRSWGHMGALGGRVYGAVRSSGRLPLTGRTGILTPRGAGVVR